MSQPRELLAALFTALVLLAAGGARAQEKTATPPVRTEAVRPPEAPAVTRELPRTEPRMNVRSSHTVDVIAPGEKIDSILGRMRVERPPPPPGRDAVRPPPGPESGRPPQGPGQSGPPHPGEGGRAPPPSPRTDGSPPQHAPQPRPPPR